MLLAFIVLPIAGKTDSEILQQTLPDGSLLLVKQVSFGKSQTSPFTGKVYPTSHDYLQIEFLLTTTNGATGGDVPLDFFLRLRAEKSPFAVESFGLRQLRCMLRGDGIEYAEELLPRQFIEKKDGYDGYCGYQYSTTRLTLAVDAD